MGNNLENEMDLILKEFNADYEEKNSSEVTVYLSITPEIHYQVQINFENYPEKPEFILPLDLYDEAGDPTKLLNRLRGWDLYKPP